jgi:hypothetical protein
MSNLKFTQTVYNGKKGILPPPDADGYHTVIVGALNTCNNAGEYYVGTGVVEAFANSSVFQDRVKSGCLYAEVGHPIKEPGMSFTDYYSRVLTIHEKFICGHFSEVWLDLEYGRNNKHLNNPEMIAIFAKVKPCGIHAQVLQTSLETPQQNTSFSIRGITANAERNGRLERTLTNIITFDHVYKPGIHVASKSSVPGLESDTPKLDTLAETPILEDMLMGCLTAKSGVFAQESNHGLRDEVIHTLNNRIVEVKTLPRW